MRRFILLGTAITVTAVGVAIYSLFGSYNAYDRLSDKLPPGATHVQYMDMDGANSSVTFDLHDRRFLMWYAVRGGTMIVEITKK